MKSLLAQGVTPFVETDACKIGGTRTEAVFSLKKNGRIYNFVARDQVMPEDPYFVLVKAVGFSIQQQEPYNGRTPSRGLKDFLIRNSVVV